MRPRMIADLICPDSTNGLRTSRFGSKALYDPLIKKVSRVPVRAAKSAVGAHNIRTFPVINGPSNIVPCTFQSGLRFIPRVRTLWDLSTPARPLSAGHPLLRNLTLVPKMQRTNLPMMLIPQCPRPFHLVLRHKARLRPKAG